jgi:hypothetical protein
MALRNFFDLRQITSFYFRDVRFGSKADMCGALGDVRFVPKADIPLGTFLGTHEGYCSRGRLFQLLFFFRHSIRFMTAIARKRDGAELLAQLVTVGWVGRRQLLGLYF